MNFYGKPHTNRKDYSKYELNSMIPFLEPVNWLYPPFAITAKNDFFS